MTERSHPTASPSDASVPPSRSESPLAFKLRLGGNADAPSPLLTAPVVDMVQPPAAPPTEAQAAAPCVIESHVIEPVAPRTSEWDAYPASIEQDSLREYKTDTEMQSIIGQLASQIVDGEGSSSSVPSAPTRVPTSRVSGRIPAIPAPVPNAAPNVVAVLTTGRHTTTMIEDAPPIGRIDVPVIVEAVPLVLMPDEAGIVVAPVCGPAIIERVDELAPAQVNASAPTLTVAPLLPKIEPKPGAGRPTKPVDFHALLSPSGHGEIQAKKRRKKRHPFRLLFKLLLVAALIGGGAYVAKKYYFDAQWKGDLKQIADRVAEQRGLSWDKAVDVIDLEPSEYALQLASSMLDVTSARSTALGSEWRAMGLAQGSIDLVAIGSAATADQPAFYDPVDKKIYELAGMSDDLRKVSLTRAFTAALLDQHFHWAAAIADGDPSVKLGVRALFDGDALSIRSALVGTVLSDPSTAAAVTAELTTMRADTAAMARGASPYAVALASMPGDAARYLFDSGSTPTAGDRDRVDAVAVGSDASVFDGVRGRLAMPVVPTVASTSAPTAAEPTTVTKSDTTSDTTSGTKPDTTSGTTVGSAPSLSTSSRGMIYWYYVLAGRLPSDQAWRSVLAWNGDLVTSSVTATGQCIDATISTFDEAGQQAIFGALQQWAAAAPVAAGTVVTSAGPTTVDVHGCDPGPDAITYTTSDTALFGQASTELAVAAGMLSAGLPRTEAARACVLNQVRFTDPPTLVRSASVDPSLSEATLDLTSPAVRDLMTACATQ